MCGRKPPLRLSPRLYPVKGRVGEIDVPGVHLLLAQAQALASTDRVEWGERGC